MNKKLMIGGGVLALLGVGYYFYTKSSKNSSTNATTKLSEVGEDINQAISTEENLVTEGIGDVLETQDENPQLVEEAIVSTKPMQVLEPISDTEPIVSMVRPMEILSIKPPIKSEAILIQKSDIMSRFSGFEGGTDFVEVGSVLTDLQ